MQYNSRRFHDSAMHIILFFVLYFCNHPLICIDDELQMRLGGDLRIYCCVTTGRTIALHLHGDPELVRRWAGHRSRSAGLGPR